MKRGWIVVAGALAFVVLGAAAYAIRARQGVAPIGFPVLASDAPRAPAGVRVRVQVLNTTGTRGLARRATRVLRDQGFDVVEMGNTTPGRDTTLVLDRSGHPEWAATIAAILGTGARTEARPDSSRYLDITVLLGSSWRPPAEPLNP